MAMDFSKLEIFYEKTTEYCLEYFRGEEEKTIWEMMEDLMDMEGLPMHCPPHHFMIPAVLLTVCHKAEGDDEEVLKEHLEEANKRAHNVLPGFCGWYGNCGAAVGCGIFLSIFTETNPHTVGEGWSWCNKVTARALTDISEVGGPRCCKRNTYLALASVHKSIEEYLEISLPKPEKVECKYFDKNDDCKGKECPFFPL